MIEFQEIIITVQKAQTTEDQWQIQVTTKINNQQHVWSLLTPLTEDKFIEQLGFYVGFGLESNRNAALQNGGL